MLRALIFDMDGVMVDTEPLYWAVARQLAARFNTTVSDETLRKMMGRSRLDSMCVFAADCGITEVEPAQLLDLRERLMLERYALGVEPMPGLVEILTRFHGKLKLAVATSSPKKFTDVLLPALKVDRFFDVIQTGDDVANGKPDPEIYLKTMSRMNVTPSESAVIEDSLAGALSAHRAGAKVIAVPTHLTAGQDFSFADQRVKGLPEATQMIEKWLAL